MGRMNLLFNLPKLKAGEVIYPASLKTMSAGPNIMLEFGTPGFVVRRAGDSHKSDSCKFFVIRRPSLNYLEACNGVLAPRISSLLNKHKIVRQYRPSNILPVCTNIERLARSGGVTYIYNNAGDKHNLLNRIGRILSLYKYAAYFCSDINNIKIDKIMNRCLQSEITFSIIDPSEIIPTYLENPRDLQSVGLIVSYFLIIPSDSPLTDSLCERHSFAIVASNVINGVFRSDGCKIHNFHPMRDFESGAGLYNRISEWFSYVEVYNKASIKNMLGKLPKKSK